VHVISIWYTCALLRLLATSASLSSRRTRPGTPATSDRGGTAMPWGTTAPAAINDPSPIVAPLRITAPIPISTPFSTVQPCRTALCPTLTPAPIWTGNPGSTWMVTPSWMLVPNPTSRGSASARSVAPYQTLTCAASVTRPITLALGATHDSACNCGLRPRMGTINGSGMRVIVFIACSAPANLGE
jgi:hypothetical protein